MNVREVPVTKATLATGQPVITVTKSVVLYQAEKSKFLSKN
jgi:hypothetical protein